VTPAPIPNISAAFIDQARALLLEEYLLKIEQCLEHLTDEQIWWRPNEQSNSIGNLLLHLAGNARQWIVSGVGGQLDKRERDWEFAQRSGMTRHDLRKRLRDTMVEVDNVLATLDQSILLERRKIQSSDPTVLEAIFHVTEHFSMHTGQIILLTKLLTAKDMKFYDFEDGKPVYRW
jgi:uncharacterized damage-inducible protein DinB